MDSAKNSTWYIIVNAVTQLKIIDAYINKINICWRQLDNYRACMPCPNNLLF